MPDIYQPIEAETSGSVGKLDVPLMKYLGEAFDQGQHDSMFDSVMKMGENHINNADPTSATLSPDEANKKYGIGDLKFNQPVKETLASAMHDREAQSMDRSMYLYSGASASRMVPGMIAQTLGATLNPLDLGSMFIPVVGEGAEAEKLFAAGKMIQGAVRRGMITSEQLSKISSSKILASAVQGMGWQGMAEIPRMAEAFQEHQPIGFEQAGLDILGQGIFAGGLHAGGQLLKSLSRGTLEAMSKEAFNQHLNDEDIHVHDYAQLDEHVIQHQVFEREMALQAEANNSVNMDKIRSDIKGSDLEYAVKAALRFPDGRVELGATHWSTPGFESGEGERGMWTNQGRFVSMEEAGKLQGLSEGESKDFTSEKLLYGTESHDEMAPDERKVYSDLLDRGFTDAEAMNTVRSNLKQRMEDKFFSRPDIQAKVAQQRQEAVNNFIEGRKAQLNMRPNEVGPVTPPHIVQKYYGDAKSTGTQLDKDIETLKGPMAEPKSNVNPDHEKYQELTKSLKGKSMDEAQGVMRQVEELKNKYGGEVPPKELIPPTHMAIDAAVECLLRIEL